MSGWVWLVAIAGGFLGAALFHAGKRLLARRRGKDRNKFSGSDEEFLASLDGEDRDAGP